MSESMIGAYGVPFAGLVGDAPGRLSFRTGAWDDPVAWRAAALERTLACLAVPDTGGCPQATVTETLVWDGLHIERLSWQLPYGPPTEAVFLKPVAAAGPLPGILALHDHGGKKYFGKRKISQVGEDIHPLMQEHRDDCYGGMAWANEVAKQGYAVLVPDAFPFASRRVLLRDVPAALRQELSDADPEEIENAVAYNRWSAEHESLMAKSLFCAGTTWPGVFLAEDQRALDVLCARADVDATRVGCGGLSGGGMRTVFLGGVDDRIRCAVTVGMMTTWRDYLLHKCFTHTWMIYVPLLPRDLDYPEILGLRLPKPALVQNNNEDPLFTLPEMQRADTMLREAYDRAGASENYRCSFYPGPHKFDAEMQQEAFAWFDRHLRA